MIAALGFVLDGIELIGSFVLWGIETFFNALLAALVAVWALIYAVLPGMPSIGTLSGSYIGWLNWLFPFGLLLDVLATVAALWVSFLAFRFLLRLIRQV